MKNEKQPADLIFTNARVFTQDSYRTVLPTADVVICNGHIAAVGTGAAAGYEAERVIDAAGKALFPGMQNLHVHVFQSLLKGLGADLSLIPWVKAALLETGPRMDPYLYSLAAKIAAIEQLKAGVTTLADFNYAQHRDDLADAGIAVWEEMGLRHIYMDVYHDTGADMGVPLPYIHDADEALRRTEKLSARYAGEDHPLTSVWMGMSVPWGTTEKLYRAVMAFSEETGTPYTLHLLETQEDNENSRAVFGKPIVPALEEIGFFTDRCLAVHTVCLTDEEIKTFATNGVNTVYCPAANCYLGSGIAPIAAQKNAGVNVTMGTDGAASNNSGDMIESLKLGIFLQRAQLRDPTALVAQDMLDFATVNAARAAHRPDLGSLEAGKTADLFLYDPHYVRSCPNHDTLASLMYNSSTENIAMTVVNGKIVYENGVFACGMEEQQVVEEAERAVRDYLQSGE